MGWLTTETPPFRSHCLQKYAKIAYNNVMNNNLLLPTDPQPTRADALKNRALLLETAQRLFNQRGVSEVPMTAIAEEAGVGKGTLYRHFQNKSELCHALLDQEMRDLQERFLRRMRNAHEPRANLEWFLEQVVTFVIQNDDLLSAQASQEPVNVLEHPAHLWWRHTIRGLLQQIKPQPDLDYATDVLYVLLDVQTLRFQHNTMGYDILRIITGLKYIVHSLT